jgi:hypothetical protein
MSFTSLWKLNLSLSTSQRNLLINMERPSWQIDVIDNAFEDFRLVHYYDKEKKLHYFDKKVTIYLDSLFIKAISFITRIEFDKVKYSHRLIANQKTKSHEPDEKKFGECKSITSWEDKYEIDNKVVSGFTIRWILKNGILKVFHFINEQNKLEVRMDFYNSKTNITSSAKKVYDRHDIPDDELKELKNSQHYKNQL